MLAGAAIAAALVLGAAAAGGAWVGVLLSPAARAILLGMALLAAAAGAAWPTRAPVPLHRLPPFVAALIGVGLLAANSAAAFIVFALAARSPTPVLAAIGGFAGMMTPAIAAATLGEHGWTALPLRRLALGGAVPLLATGLYCVAGGLRVI